jgi:hypothetical protein
MQFGSSAHSWRLRHNALKIKHGGELSDSVRIENEAERLVVLQALETYRALKQAVKDAPHGKGLAFTEAVVHDKGFDHLHRMYESARQEHPEAQKKRPAVLDVRAGKRRPSGV